MLWLFLLLLLHCYQQFHQRPIVKHNFFHVKPALYPDQRKLFLVFPILTPAKLEDSGKISKMRGALLTWADHPESRQRQVLTY